MSETLRSLGVDADGDEIVVIDRDTQQASRKGWIALSQLRGRLYKLGDGRWLKVRAYEDMDFWSASHGTAVDWADEERRGEADMSPEAVEARALAKARQAEAIRFVASYTGSWGLILDIRANPKWGTKYLSLSERQVEVILNARDRDEERRTAGLEQARINTELANDDEYLRYVEGLIALGNAVVERLEANDESQSPQDSRLAPQQASAPPMGGKVTEGMYKLPDGRIVKAQLAVNGSGHIYGKVLDTDTGRFEYAPGLLREVRPEHRMTVEEAGAFGKLYGRCIVCGRTLTDETSIANGIGPICAGRV